MRSFTDYKKGCGLVAEIFGRCAVDTFLIPQFEQVIQRMIQNGWAKRTINHRIDAIKKMFEYAYTRDGIKGEQLTKIKSVPRIKADDPRVKPEKIVPAVPVDVVERTLPYLTPMIADIVRVQLKAGMRAAEVCQMRYDELHWDADGILWYRPAKHKTASKGEEAEYSIGTTLPSDIAEIRYRAEYSLSGGQRIRIRPTTSQPADKE